MVWEINNICNERCQTCSFWREEESQFVLSRSQALRFIEQCASADVRTICFTGGEPFLRKDVFDLLEFAKLNGLQTEVITNGLLLTERKAKRVAQSRVDRLFISLDAAEASLNDALRGLQGDFDLTMTAIDHVKTVRRSPYPQIVLQATISTKNVDQLPGLAECALEKGVEGFCFNLAWDFEGTHFSLDEELMFDEDSIRKLELQLRQLLRKHKAILYPSDVYYQKLVEQIAHNEFSHLHPQGWNAPLMYVDAWGNAFTAADKKVPLGNVQDATAEALIKLTGQAAVGNNVPVVRPVNGFQKQKRIAKWMRPIVNGVKSF